MPLNCEDSKGKKTILGHSKQFKDIRPLWVRYHQQPDADPEFTPPITLTKYFGAMPAWTSTYPSMAIKSPED